MRVAPLALVTLLVNVGISAAEPVDLDLVTRIRDEGLRRSQVMSYAAHLTDRIGPRLTGSPAMATANAWALDTFAALGLTNARLEPYRFGRGWSWSRCALDLAGEGGQSLFAIPQAWTPGTKGPVEGEAVRLDATTAAELPQHKGKLKGKFVLIDPVRVVEPPVKVPFRRYSDDELREEGRFTIPPEIEVNEWTGKYEKRVAFRRALDAFLAAEGALGILEVGSRDGGILRVPRGGEPVDPAPMSIPAVIVMTEHYNRLVRLVDAGQTVRLRLDVGASFHEGDGMAFNAVAELPGRGKAEELVIVGAHLDSYHAGTGAADNAAGVSIMLEAMRIVKALGIQPKRTIRIVLWSGEEQGLLGSYAYVDQQFASRPPWPAEELTKPLGLRAKTGARSFKPAHSKVSAYFNADNGGGKIRGIYLEENAAARPIFEAWIEPLRDLGVTTISPQKTGSTDHARFDEVGIPGFQFIQDPMDYFSQTHHTNLDTYDHLHSDDLRQAAVVMATIIIHAANRDEMIPRKPRPKE
ncbi:MAG: M20/M25/M40 family metallo-hydrolase [Thermoanaerobaculia bacterium]